MMNENSSFGSNELNRLLVFWLKVGEVPCAVESVLLSKQWRSDSGQIKAALIDFRSFF